MPIDHTQQTVLITGASSGIGRAFARELARRGSDVVLVARRADRLNDLADELRAAHGGGVTVLPCDLTAAGAAERLRAELARQAVRVTALINDAGFGTFGAFVDEDGDRLEQELTLDVVVPVQMVAAFLPSFVAARSGYVVNVASMAAYSPTPRMAVYGAAKAFVLSFSESLWAELQGSGVLAFALSPGATSTEFNAVVGTDDATAGARMRTPEHVVSTALAHLERRNPGPSVIDGRVNRLGAVALRLMARRTTVSAMNRLTDPARRGEAGDPAG